MNNPRRRHRRRSHHRRTWRPFARKTIKMSNLGYLLIKIAIASVVLYSVAVTIKMKYYETRCYVMETSIDSFYNSDKVSDISNNKKLQDKMNQIAQVYQTSIEQYISISEVNNKLNKSLVDIAEDIVILDLENIELIEARDEYKTALEEYQSREDLLNKYEDALFYRGDRTDITYDQLKTGIEIMEDNGIDPALLFGIIMVESHGIEDAQNVTSSAAGYGQILTSTGRSVYEKYMGNGKGTFKSSMLLDGDENVKITAYYIDYCVKHNSSIKGALNSYRGGPDDKWEYALEVYLKSFDTSLSELQTELY